MFQVTTSNHKRKKKKRTTQIMYSKKWEEHHWDTVLIRIHYSCRLSIFSIFFLFSQLLRVLTIYSQTGVKPLHRQQFSR